MQFNILVNSQGDVQLTDFGMSLLAGANAGNYASKHGGGALQFRSPELLDPESFGLDNDRPSITCDVYSLAIVAVEVMSWSILLLCAAHHVHFILSPKAVHRCHAVWQRQDRRDCEKDHG